MRKWISRSTDDSHSVSKNTISTYGQRLLLTVGIVVVLLTFLSSPVAASSLDICYQSPPNSDEFTIAPSDPGYNNPGYEFKNEIGVIRQGIGALMVLGPMAGIGIALYSSFMIVVSSTNPEKHAKHRNARKKALIGGFAVPALAYLFQAGAPPVLGLEIQCIVP